MMHGYIETARIMIDVAYYTEVIEFWNITHFASGARTLRFI